jgi:chaperone modulatory protein CbpM
MSDPNDELHVQLLGEESFLAVQECCRVCGLELTTIVELADEGVISPRGASPDSWQLPATALPRLRAASRLMRDLGVNVTGVALALELLDVQRELERRLHTLERLVRY